MANLDPGWNHAANELFFIAPDANVMTAAVTPSKTTFEAAPPVALFQTRILSGASQLLKHQYAVSRDGRFLISEPAGEFAPAPITIVLNWTRR